MKNKITLIITLSFGLEAVVKRELIALGFHDLCVSNGKIELDAKIEDIPTLNLWLRSADRVLLKLGEFEAKDFDSLYEGTYALPWEEWIPEDGRFPINGVSVNSILESVPACQSIVKKAIVERLGEEYDTNWFEEDGAEFPVKVSIHKDIATLTLDTSGTGLNRRGYRIHAGPAPLKETLAAALVQLSFWRDERLLVDPMCGSGTILIEAAMIGRNIAPGLNRTFTSEDWAQIPSTTWEQARNHARSCIISDKELNLFGYDIDEDMIYASKSNAKAAGVGGDIEFAQKDIHDLWIDQEHGIMISNFPYGVKMGGFAELNQIYISVHKTFRHKLGWSVYVLTADRKFPDYFKRARPNKRRKLFNGALEVAYYQYFGAKPEK
ncbi:MAG: class I SAM-dependent RNA methyltransferase [Anaerolineae bacterium]|jgi:putative N6-adenine-specific DNA methylase|nr:class I SAM-dependent RNA methyltransferase [Anaerolineae bacterium]MBT7075549.1 class I SAM-dependent RNA methyltransferase [Anaerolineae bacterium]MBT7783387.1 class I SAM-dependent RNA methyltransferase [Anaerolineae bacterium]